MSILCKIMCFVESLKIYSSSFFLLKKVSYTCQIHKCKTDVILKLVYFLFVSGNGSATEMNCVQEYYMLKTYFAEFNSSETSPE